MKTPVRCVMFVKGTKLHSRMSIENLFDRHREVSCRVVANDLPSVRRLLNNEHKMAFRVAASSRGTFQMKISRHRSEAFVEWLHLESIETERAHLLFGGVVLAVGVHHLIVAARYLGTDKEDVRRFFVAGRERVQIS